MPTTNIQRLVGIALRDLPQTYSGEGPIPWPAVPG